MYKDLKKKKKKNDAQQLYTKKKEKNKTEKEKSIWKDKYFAISITFPFEIGKLKAVRSWMYEVLEARRSRRRTQWDLDTKWDF